ncbi:MAG TPA: DNA-directed RNA polymerase subunit omega, partial [Vicinamibacterales bacterium]|nr:DNA-directed RNA polymerase subunit omega [Vicinamibacterales bacterium]
HRRRRAVAPGPDAAISRKDSQLVFKGCTHTMIDRSKLSNSFEFVVTAGARARQLLAGSTPRVVVGEHKKTTVAQTEVMTRQVEKIEPEPKPVE